LTSENKIKLEIFERGRSGEIDSRAREDEMTRSDNRRGKKKGMR
jgi:hypothetical protein